MARASFCLLTAWQPKLLLLLLLLLHLLRLHLLLLTIEPRRLFEAFTSSIIARLSCSTRMQSLNKP